MTQSVYERVKKRAYEIWEEEGHPWGRDMIHWERAHQEIAGEAQSGSPSDEACVVVLSEAAATLVEKPAKAPAKRVAKKSAV